MADGFSRSREKYPRVDDRRPRRLRAAERRPVLRTSRAADGRAGDRRQRRRRGHDRRQRRTSFPWILGGRIHRHIARWQDVETREAVAARGVLALSIDQAGRIAVVTESHVFRQTATGWDEHPGPSSGTIHSAGLGFDANGGVAVLAATGAAEVPHKTDIALGLERWRSYMAGRQARPALAWRIGKPPRFRAVTMSTQHAGVAFAGFEELTLTTASCTTASREPATTDARGRWSTAKDEAVAMLEGSWVEQRAMHPGPDIWFDAPVRHLRQPRESGHRLRDRLFRTYRTLDGGAPLGAGPFAAGGTERLDRRAAST